MNLDRIIAVRTDKTVYRDGDRCLKVFNEDFSKADVLNEALNQARVEETGLNIPKILEVTVIDGKWTIVSEFIKGKTLARLMEENPEKKDEYLSLFVDLQLQMHSKTCKGLTKLKDKMNRKISETDLSATVRYDLHTRLESMPKHNKVCHGDFNPTNIIITDDAKRKLLEKLMRNGDIDGAKKYLDLFCERSNTAKQYVQKWMPIVAASQTVKGNEAEREFLHSWIDVVDYE